jgi:hypothetical protein
MEHKLEQFKKSLHNAMLENFKKDGYLAPMLFFFQDNQPLMAIIPKEMLSSVEGKHKLSDFIRNKCLEPNVLATGIIIEAHSAKMDVDKEEAEKVFNGEMRVSQMKNAQDIILLSFSTPEKEEMFAYYVDYKTKTIGECLADGDMGGTQGIFSDFYKWNKN